MIFRNFLSGENQGISIDENHEHWYNYILKSGSPYQPMEVLTAVVYGASLIHPTATAGVADS